MCVGRLDVTVTLHSLFKWKDEVTNVIDYDKNKICFSRNNIILEEDHELLGFENEWHKHVMDIH